MSYDDEWDDALDPDLYDDDDGPGEGYELVDDDYIAQLATAKIREARQQVEEQEQAEYEALAAKAHLIEQKLGRSLTGQELGRFYDETQANPDTPVNAAIFERDIRGDENERTRYAAEVANDHFADSDDPDVEFYEEP